MSRLFPAVHVFEPHNNLQTGKVSLQFNSLFVPDVLNLYSQGLVTETSIPYLVTIAWSPDSSKLALYANTYRIGPRLESPLPHSQIFDIQSNTFIDLNDGEDFIERPLYWLTNDSILYAGIDNCVDPCYYLDWYRININDNQSTALSDVTDLEERIRSDVCKPSWNTSTQILYYVVGCGGYGDQTIDSIFATSLTGEANFLFQTGEGFEDLEYAVTTNLLQSDDGIYAAMQYMTNTRDYTWRIWHINSDVEITEKVSLIPGERPELEEVIQSERYWVFFGSLDDGHPTALIVVDRETGERIFDYVDSTNFICQLTWLSESRLLLSTQTERFCWNNGFLPQDLWMLNIETQEIVQLEEDTADAKIILSH